MNSRLTNTVKSPLPILDTPHLLARWYRVMTIPSPTGSRSDE